MKFKYVYRFGLDPSEIVRGDGYWEVSQQNWLGGTGTGKFRNRIG